MRPTPMARDAIEMRMNALIGASASGFWFSLLSYLPLLVLFLLCCGSSVNSLFTSSLLTDGLQAVEGFGFEGWVFEVARVHELIGQRTAVFQWGVRILRVCGVLFDFGQ